MHEESVKSVYAEESVSVYKVSRVCMVKRVSRVCVREESVKRVKVNLKHYIHM